MPTSSHRKKPCIPQQPASGGVSLLQTSPPCSHLLLAAVSWRLHLNFKQARLSAFLFFVSLKMVPRATKPPDPAARSTSLLLMLQLAPSLHTKLGCATHHCHLYPCTGQSLLPRAAKKSISLSTAGCCQESQPVSVFRDWLTCIQCTVFKRPMTSLRR